MWGDLSFADIKILDDYIKRLDIDYENVRKESKKINKELKKKTFAITLNPKIDSKKQRRLQCGIPYKKFIELFIDNKLEKNIIWGKKFDINLKSKPRTFRK